MVMVPSGSGRVVQDPRILGGEPTIRGSRIPARSVVQTFMIYSDLERVREAFPSLGEEDIRAALDYYAQHRAVIDRWIAENDADDD